MKTVSFYLPLLLGANEALAFNVAPSRTRIPVKSARFAAADYTPMDGEKKMNLKIDLDSPKVATQDTVCRGDKNVYCRCWLSETFPLCDGTHMKHNKATGDNVGPLIVSVPKAKEAEAETPKDDAKIAGRKNRVVMGYKAIIASYIAMSSYWYYTAGISKFPLFYSFGNLVLPAGVAYIMISAAENNRLGSDTYKRLNLALLEYGIVGMLLKRTSPLMIFPYLFSIINSIKGYSYGVLGWDKKNSDASLVSDLVEGTKSTVKGLLSIPKNIKSLGYLAATLGVASLKFSQLADIVKPIQPGVALGDISQVALSKFGRFAFLTFVLYTLKDAADRDRLEGTTFIQLNYLSALILAANSAFLGGFATKVGGAAACFSAFCAFNGISSFFKRNTV